MTENEWHHISTAPERQIVETKVDDADGVRNVQKLYRDGCLWWTPDGRMYVYYTPTHWRPTPTGVSPLPLDAGRSS